MNTFVCVPCVFFHIYKCDLHSILFWNDERAELRDEGGKGGFQLNLKAVESEAQLSSGYNQMLQFEVHDLDNVVARCVQLGASLDGPIVYPAHGKIASFRTMDGHMIGIYEPNI